MQELQRQASKQRQMATIQKQVKAIQKQQKRSAETFELRCLKCDEFACLSSDVRIVQDSHRIVIDTTFKNRSTLRPHPKPVYRGADGEFATTGKLFCGKCDSEWGIQALYKSIPFPVLKLANFVVVNVRRQSERDTYKQWKDCPFQGKNFSMDEIDISDYVDNY